MRLSLPHFLFAGSAILTSSFPVVAAVAENSNRQFAPHTAFIVRQCEIPAKTTLSKTNGWYYRTSSARHILAKPAQSAAGKQQRLLLSPLCWRNTNQNIQSPSSRRSSDGNDVEFAKADDGEALQALFSKQCDADGLMTKALLMSVPAIAELLNDGDLLSTELDQIWDAAPKFPELDTSSSKQGERVDVDSFVQIYRDIDDLFEEDDEEDNVRRDPGVAAATAATTITTPTTSATIAKGASDSISSASNGNTNIPPVPEKKSTLKSSKDMDESVNDDDDDDPVVAYDEQELEVFFRTICDDAELVSRDSLRSWNEVDQLINDGMLSEEEFNDIWSKTPKSPGSSDMVDVDGFLSFNVALDDLFVFTDDGEMDSVARAAAKELSEAELATTSQSEREMVVGDDIPPDVLFANLAVDGLVGMGDIQRWGELRSMIDDGDLLPSELDEIFSTVEKVDEAGTKIDKDGFFKFYTAIFDLFEDDYDDKGIENTPPVSDIPSKSSSKQKLLSLISSIISKDSDLLPCGLECTESEELQVLEAVTSVENEPSNLLIANDGIIEEDDIVGEWQLLFSTSSAMKFNKGLSGIGGSFPNGRFGGLRQVLAASKFTSDVEYIERINVNPGENSFDVTITGNWQLKSSVSLFTGEPSVVLSVEPYYVTYGPTKTRADHWKSLGPMNVLDITYLDKELRIMRGNTSTNTIFVFSRASGGKE